MGLFSLFHRRKKVSEIDEEIESHLRMAEQDRIARGETADEAHFAARREFGNAAVIAETTRSVWSWTAVEQFFQDMRLGARILTRSPAFSLSAIALIALVIGGNATVYSTVHALITSPAPGVEAKNLVVIGVMIDGKVDDPGNSYPVYEDYAAQTRSLSHIMVRGFERFTVNSQHGTFAVMGSLISPNYFETLGVHPARGRFFTEGEHRLDASGLAAVISDRLWRDWFQGSEDVIGKPLFLSGHAATIVGVAPPRFRGPEFGGNFDVWAPLLSYVRLRGSQAQLLDRSHRFVEMIGRLAPGVSLDQAQAEFAIISKRLQTAYPGSDGDRSAVLAPYSAAAFNPAHRMAPMFLGIFAVVTLLTLIIVSANVANLMLGRAVARQRELALRQTLGASRMRILRVILAEGLAVSLPAWAAAFWVSQGVSKLILGWTPANVVVDSTLDWRAAGYSMVLAIAATLIFTTAPAVRSWGQAPLPALRAGEFGIAPGASGVSRALVVAQLAFSVVLLTAAGLAYRSLSMVDALKLGFNRDNLLFVSANTSGSASTRDANALLLERLRARLSAVPGVTAASYARGTPRSMRSTMAVYAPLSRKLTVAEYNYVGPEYFGVLGVQTIAGLDTIEEQYNRGAPTAIISENLASELWPGRSPIGQTILINSASGQVRVAAVVPNGFYLGPAPAVEPRFVFLSEQQDPAEPGGITFHLRYSGNASAVARAVSAAIQETDARVAVNESRTMETMLKDIAEPIRVITMLLAVFSIGSLIIASIGQYAVIAFNMRRRIRDFGVRMTLGASAHQITTSVLKEGLLLSTFGLAIGFGLSLATGRLTGRFLYGVSPTDLATYAGVFSVLAFASLLACYIPARRASRIDPMHALRQE